MFVCSCFSSSKSAESGAETDGADAGAGDWAAALVLFFLFLADDMAIFE